MEDNESAINWDICGCGRKYIRLSSDTCLHCHIEEEKRLSQEEKENE